MLMAVVIVVNKSHLKLLFENIPFFLSSTFLLLNWVSNELSIFIFFKAVVLT